MDSVKLKHLNKLTVLKTIERELLMRFLGRFNEHFEANGLTLPPPELADGEFYAATARLLRMAERLCPELNEALLAIDELATTAAVAGLSVRAEWRAVFGAEGAETPNFKIQTPKKVQEPSSKLDRSGAGLRGPVDDQEPGLGQAPITKLDAPVKVQGPICKLTESGVVLGGALLRSRSTVEGDRKSQDRRSQDCGSQDSGSRERTAADLVMELWLGNPDFVRSCYNTWRLKRLSSFEHASSGLAPEQRAVFAPDDRTAIMNFTMALDGWFARNHRGDETTRIEVYPMDGEYWYLIRHGGLFTRTPKVERQETHIIQFRPERDDVLVYSPELDEVRVNARTKGERDMYIEQFGVHLCGDAGYFRERRTYTLEPLRHGPVVLECDPMEGIERITLKSVQVERNNHLQEVMTHEATDLFQCAPGDPRSMTHFGEGMLARALFEIQFSGQMKPQAVEIRVPNTLKMSRRCDVRALRNWLVRSGMRVGK